MNKAKLKANLPLFGFVAVLIIVALLSFSMIDEEKVDFTSSTSIGGSCNVGVVSITGHLDTDGYDSWVDSLTVAQTIRTLAANSSHDALLVLVDSAGGTAPAAEEISDALGDVDMPNASLVRGNALSGGYWVASATDHIVAQASSAVGNIGVTMSYLDETKLNDIEGYTYQEIASGEYKEVGGINKPLLPNHKAYLQAHVDKVFAMFADQVKTSRKFTDEQFQAVSDGKFYTGAEALSLGLIDQVGGISEVKQYFAGQLEKDVSDISICQPHNFDL